MKIYHNPRCSKSRQTLKLIQDHGHEPEIIEYLKNPLSASQLAEIVKMLKMKPEQLIRKGESVFKEKFMGKDLNDAGWLKVMAENPELMERPIVVAGSGAILGRPPENVLELFKK